LSSALGCGAIGVAVSSGGIAASPLVPAAASTVPEVFGASAPSTPESDRISHHDPPNAAPAAHSATIPRAPTSERPERVERKGRSGRDDWLASAMKHLC
jgi:hypothetical protein